MNILFVTSYYGEQEGGADISTKLLAQGMDAAEVSINIASINVRKQQGIHQLFTYAPLPTRFIAFLLNTSFLDNWIAKRLSVIISKTKPDVLHVHDIMLLPATLHAAKKKGLPVIVTVRDLRFQTNLPMLSMKDLKKDYKKPWIYFRELMRQKGFLLALCGFPFVFHRAQTLRRALHAATYLVAISYFVKARLIACGFSAENISVVYNPMPLWQKGKSSKRNAKPYFLAPGRLEQYKGFHLLIKAIRILHDQGCSHTLLIAGEGPEEKNLQMLARKNGVEKQVHFLGKVPYAELQKYYQSCTAVLFPSLWPEPLGRVPLEAMAVNKPCIATAVGGIPEIVPKEHLVAPTPEAFAEKMKEIIERS